MWRSRIVLAAALMTLLSGVASATVYTFQSTDTSALSPNPVSFSFSLDTATAVSSGNGATFNNVSIIRNGVSSSGNSITAAFGTEIESPLFALIDTSSLMEPFYSGAGSGIVFNLATFAIAEGFTDGEGTLTIASNAVSPVPEPATWTLLLTGGAIAAAWFSRRSGSGIRAVA